ncbi:MAG: hypothetical protein R3F59_23660 [Myxococcota bacterium]
MSRMTWMVVMVAAGCAKHVPEPAPVEAEPMAPAEHPQVRASGASVASPAAASPADGMLGCANEVQMVCTEGHRDGCATGKTLVHVCVADSEEAGPPCEQEIAKECPEGQMDACQGELAATHLCVVATHD